MEGKKGRWTLSKMINFCHPTGPEIFGVAHFKAPVNRENTPQARKSVFPGDTDAAARMGSPTARLNSRPLIGSSGSPSSLYPTLYGNLRLFLTSLLTL